MMTKLLTTRQSLLLLWGGQFMTMASLEMSGPFWPVYLRELSPLFSGQQLLFWSGAVYAAPMATAILSAPLWGWLGDRYGHKLMVLRAVLALAATQIMIAYSQTVESIFLWRLVQGGCAGVIAASMAYAVMLGTPANRGQILTSLQSSTAAGSLIGPIIGGVIITQLDYQSLFLSASICCLVITLLFALFLNSGDQVATRDSQKSCGNSSMQENSPAGFPWLITALICAAITITQIAKMMPQSYFALFVEQIGGDQPILLGLIFSTTGLAILISTPLWGLLIDRISQTASLGLLIFLSLACAALLWLHQYATDLIRLALMRFAWGLCLGAFLPMLFNLLSQFAGTSGRIIGFGNSFSKVGNLGGYLGGALAASLLGFTGAFQAIGLLYLLLAACLLALIFFHQNHAASTSVNNIERFWDV
ncbi:MAG: hypothetical protein COB23_04110 [Methylophaga sp.]|nr:MAG: hypothetical protein COB23_04110 [Methylophaga sp.]